MGANNVYYPSIDRAGLISPENYTLIDDKRTGLPLKVTVKEFTKYIGDNIDIEIPEIPDVELPFVTPEMFGAVGDGVTDDSIAIQSAVNSGQPVLLQSTYMVLTSISMPESSSIYGMNYILKTTNDISILDINGSYVTIDSVFFLGNSSVSALQRGISLVGPADMSETIKNLSVSNCRFKKLNSGFYSKYAATTIKYGAAMLSNCYAEECTSGFFCDIRSEYISFSNCHAVFGGTGFVNYGGNNSWVGGSISSNNLGVEINGFGISGNNDGHAVVSGVRINHNSTAIRVSDSIYGYTFANCHIYENNAIQVVYGNLVNFVGCDISVNALVFNNATNLSFKACNFPTTPAFGVTLPVSGQKARFLDCIFTNGTPSDLGIAFNVDNVEITSTTFNIANIDTVYTFTGVANAVGTFGLLANSVGVKHIFINKAGPGITLTLNSNNGISNDIYESGAATNTLTLNPGEVFVSFNDKLHYTQVN